MLDTGPGEPAHNMALDEALLLTAGPPTLRLYSWRPHAVSLGHFQDVAPFRDLPGRPPIVRRLTGGGAILHGDELTFALVIDTHLLPAAIDDGYAMVHAAMAAALGACGVAVDRLGQGAPAGPRPDEPWCFREPGRHDLVDPAGRKLLGSAQRRIRRPRPRVLHHGSLVLHRPPLTPFTAAVADVAPPEDLLPRLRAGFVRRLGEALGLRPTAGAAAPGELALAADLRRDRYANPDWTFHRTVKPTPGA